MENLKSVIDKSIYILRETKAQFNNPCVLWSTGKDSTATLSLCREAFFDEIPFDVVHIDTGWKFKEMYEFRDYLEKLWDFKLIVTKSEYAGKHNPNISDWSHKKCCTKLKTEALKKIIEEKNPSR